MSHKDNTLKKILNRCGLLTDALAALHSYPDHVCVCVSVFARALYAALKNVAVKQA